MSQLLLILFLIIFFETYKITEFNKDIKRTREMYLEKTDLVFKYLLLNNISFISPAETLGQLSTVDNEDYQQVQKLLDLAKLQTEKWENSLYHLIYVSDTRERKLSFEHGVNNYIMSTQKQQDIRKRYKKGISIFFAIRNYIVTKLLGKIKSAVIKTNNFFTSFSPPVELTEIAGVMFPCFDIGFWYLYLLALI